MASELVVKRIVGLALSLAAVCIPAFTLCFAQSTTPLPEIQITQDQTLLDVLLVFQSQGVPLVFSTNVVTRSMVVFSPPSATGPIEQLEQILLPHGLTLKYTSDHYVVARLPTAKRSTPDDVRLRKGSYASGSDELEQVTVTASFYRLGKDPDQTKHQLNREQIEAIPSIGEDPLRALQRLPGVSSKGISSQLRFRGGHGDETGILINGQKLADPYHIRDFQNLFSVIDTRIAQDIEVYSGGFPAQYGNQLAGLVLIDSVEPEENSVTEIGASIFNSSLFTAGTFGEERDNKYVLLLRRGNLDLILDETYGKPKYHDVFAEVQFQLNDKTSLSLNALRADDKVTVSVESDPVEEETSNSRIDDNNIWLRLDQRWSPDLRSETSLSYMRQEQRRNAVNLQFDKLEGEVADWRRIERGGFRQDWTWNPQPEHTLRFGGEYQRLSARYVYDSSVDYFEEYLAYENIDGGFTRSVRLAPEGEAYSLYLSDRWNPVGDLSLGIGLRWDRQTYTDQASDRNMLSPRISAAYQWSGNTSITASWGRYFQSQSIADMQVEDGVNQFNAAQRSDQAILGLQHRIGEYIRFRAELYTNDISRVMPRYENVLDPIALIPELEPDRWRLEPRRGRSSGLELSLARVETDEDGVDLNWWITYVLSKSEDKINGRWEPRSWDQLHAFQAGVVYDSDRWQLSAAVNVNSGWPTTSLGLSIDSDTDEPRLTFGRRNAGRLNQFASVDVKATRNLQLVNSELSIYFEMTNILGRDNECCIDYSFEEDLNEELFLERSSEYGLPRLPAVGFRWSF